MSPRRLVIPHWALLGLPNGPSRGPQTIAATNVLRPDSSFETPPAILAGHAHPSHYHHRIRSIYTEFPWDVTATYAVVTQGGEPSPAGVPRTGRTVVSLAAQMVTHPAAGDPLRSTDRP